MLDAIVIYKNRGPLKKSILKIITVLSLSVIGLIHLNYSSNPPIDRTNRTGANCTGCHSGSLNPTGGSISITSPTSYYPGKTYTITLALTGGTVYGFEITTVQSSSTSTGAGSFSGTGFNTTTSGGRPYARQSLASSTSSFAITWKAPATNVGTVAIYGAGVAANSNGGNSGDKTYASTKTIAALNLITFLADSTSILCGGINTGKIVIKNVTGGAGAPYTYKWSSSASIADSLVNLGPGTYSVTVTDKGNNEAIKTVKLSAPAVISNTFTASASLCADSTGWALPSITGGKIPYSVSWPTGVSISNDSAINLKSGSYIITITDKNGCSIIDTAEIKESGSNITFSINSNPEFCNNGWGEAIVSNITNAIGVPSFNWSNSKTGASIDSLSAGIYSVTISDGNGCTSAQSVSVANQSNTLVFTTSEVDDKCNQSIGSSQVINLSGGIAPYDYRWSNGSISDSALGLTKGRYFVTVTDSMRCSAIQLVTIEDAVSPNLSLSKTDLSCFEDSSGKITSNATGGAKPYQYAWSDGTKDSIANNLIANKLYTLIVTDANGCLVVDSANLTQPSKLEVDTLVQISNNDSTCDESIRIEIAGGTPGYSYSWNTGLTDSLLSGLCAGDYICSVVDKNGCSIIGTISVIDNDLTNIYSNTVQITAVYPNPTSSIVFLKSTVPIVSISVLGLAGQIIKTRLGQDIIEYDLSDLDKGIYFLHLTNSEGEKELQRIIKD